MKFKVAPSNIASSRLAIYMRNSLQERKKGGGETRGRKGGKEVREKGRKKREGEGRGGEGRKGDGRMPTFTVLYSLKGHRPTIILSESTNELHSFKKRKVRTQEAILSSSPRSSCQWKTGGKSVWPELRTAQGWKQRTVGIRTGRNQPQ